MANLIDDKKSFIEALAMLINHRKWENKSNTPDFILAEYLFKCLENFNEAVDKRTNWQKM